MATCPLRIFAYRKYMGIGNFMDKKMMPFNCKSPNINTTAPNTDFSVVRIFSNYLRMQYVCKCHCIFTYIFINIGIHTQKNTQQRNQKNTYTRISYVLERTHCICAKIEKKCLSFAHENAISIAQRNIKVQHFKCAFFET